MWEDEQNKKGGRWLVNMNKNQRHHDLDNVWQEIVSTWSFSCSPVFLCAAVPLVCRNMGVLAILDDFCIPSCLSSEFVPVQN